MSSARANRVESTDRDGAENASGTDERSSSPRGRGDGGNGVVDGGTEGEQARTGTRDADDVVFVPTGQQVRVARHLGHRLELARTVATGIREKIADLKQQLDVQAREVRHRMNEPSSRRYPSLIASQTSPPKKKKKKKPKNVIYIYLLESHMNV